MMVWMSPLYLKTQADGILQGGGGGDGFEQNWTLNYKLNNIQQKSMISLLERKNVKTVIRKYFKVIIGNRKSYPVTTEVVHTKYSV